MKSLYHEVLDLLPLPPQIPNVRRRRMFLSGSAEPFVGFIEVCDGDRMHDFSSRPAASSVHYRSSGVNPTWFLVKSIFGVTTEFKAFALGQSCWLRMIYTSPLIREIHLQFQKRPPCRAHDPVYQSACLFFFACGGFNPKSVVNDHSSTGFQTSTPEYAILLKEAIQLVNTCCVTCMTWVMDLHEIRPKRQNGIRNLLNRVLRTLKLTWG
jgi:hypothetical protein